MLSHCKKLSKRCTETVRFKSPLRPPHHIVKQKILVILGPTASGKSELGIRLAKKFNGEVVSADSRQVYRGLDIGTGKITKREMQGVRHHLLDVAGPKRQFTAAEYKKLAERAIGDILARGKLPIIVGGTGFYIDTLLGNVSLPIVPTNPTLRKRLAKKTLPELFAMLKKLDPRRARGIDRHNPRRLIRAIEIATALGNVPAVKTKKPFDVLYIGLTIPKDILRKKINTRLVARLKHGMVAEAKRLHERSLSLKRMDEIGLEYRFLARYLQKKISKEEMVQGLASAIWRYAKRQMTWWRRNTQIMWFQPDKKQVIENNVRKFLNDGLMSRWHLGGVHFSLAANFSRLIFGLQYKNLSKNIG